MLTSTLTKEELTYLQSLSPSECELILREKRKRLSDSKNPESSKAKQWGGHLKKTLAEHLRDGTYRPDRHKHLVDEEQQWIEFPRIPIRPKVHFKPQIPFDYDELIEQYWPADRLLVEPNKIHPLEQNVLDAVNALPQDLSEEYARQWVWDESDEYAIANGCRFDLRRAMHFAYTSRNCFKVWEGKYAGDPLIPRTWQPEFGLRMFGWVRPQEDNRVPWVRRFSKAAAWVGKKNGKSPFAASVGDYLWRFDGVWRLNRDGGMEFCKIQGQHVYSMAKNGIQAGIVHNHAYLMAINSPVLSYEFETKECTYNKVKAVLTHEPSNSTYEKLAGDSKRGADTSEGKNAGGLICDEAHVVDQTMVDANTDMGASAEQFLWCQISTDGAGDGYGKSDKQYGLDVAEGRIKDDAFLFRHYGAAKALQPITDEEAGDPELWKKANPAWGFTVNPLQFKQAYERAKGNPARLSAFKRRRLDVWQDAEFPMIDQTAWAACADSELSLDDFAGQSIAGGLDLAQVGDFCAFVMVFQDAEDVYHVWPKFWASDKFQAKYKDKTPCLEWPEDALSWHAGEVRLSEVQKDVQELIEEYDISVVGYDAMFAAQMAQDLEAETSCDIAKYPQTLQAYANGTAIFNRAIGNENRRRIRHPGHPVLDWMAKHVECEERNDMQKPTKNADTPWNKVDGIQAMIMAIDCVHYVDDDVGSAYDEPGGLAL